jgi:hypothetical protein
MRVLNSSGLCIFRTLRAGLALCAFAISALLFLDTSTAGWLEIGLLVIARVAITGTFSTLYIITPELYPTVVRSVGLSLCNALGRIGGLLAPFMSVYLVGCDAIVCLFCWLVELTRQYFTGNQDVFL